MKEFYDCLKRLNIELKDGDRAHFIAYADHLVRLGGVLVQELDGLDQSYWDFRFGDTTIVLHSDVFCGISLHVEDQQNDVLLRRVAALLWAGE
jgi:hypothetical protein